MYVFVEECLIKMNPVRFQALQIITVNPENKQVPSYVDSAVKEVKKTVGLGYAKRPEPDKPDVLIGIREIPNSGNIANYAIYIADGENTLTNRGNSLANTVIRILRKFNLVSGDDKHKWLFYTLENRKPNGLITANGSDEFYVRHGERDLAFNRQGEYIGSHPVSAQ